jgi:oxygen-independent coproporphyrinogen-3 oxidase
VATGLYIHIPFCLRKCGYCDFYSVLPEPGMISRYIRALLTELSLAAELQPGSLETIYFGGGTPSLLAPEQVAEILQVAGTCFKINQNVEITLEANPGTFDYQKVRGYREAGVNRISIGAQSFAPDLLQILGRSHTVQHIFQAVEYCRRAGFDNLNLDLIYGIPGQDEQALEDTLCQAVQLEVDHISAYLLQLAPETPMGRQVSCRQVEMLPEDMELDQYTRIINRLTRAGYHQYEISNFARMGKECRHNLLYWQGGEYLGLGAGAVGYLNGSRIKNYGDVTAYMTALEAGQLPLREELELVTGQDLWQERIIMGLRLTRGINFSRFQEQYGIDILSEFADVLKVCTDTGLMEISGEQMRLTRRGFFLSNEVFCRFLA